jgi:succinyl-diaminopimelate desuccinylase
VADTRSQALDLTRPATELTAALVDVESVSGNEDLLADLIEAALTGLPMLTVQRRGNVLLARTDFGRSARVLLAGHLDTVPLAGNLPSEVRDGRLYGCGTSDMKSGVALQLRAAQLIGTGELVPSVDVSFVFYDCEEIESERNGLLRLVREAPAQLQADLAVLLEPTNGLIEGGCQGTMRATVSVPGARAHSARSWLGDNAIHAAAPVLQRLADYAAREVEVDGLSFREGLNAVFISGGVAGNVIPDLCTVTVNFRFAPDRSEQQAADHVREVFAGYDVAVVDSAPAARPGLSDPLAREFAAAVGGPVSAKFGWTDVARFTELGIPALNFGPGDPNLAHKVDESVALAAIATAEAALLSFLAG